MSGDQPEVVTFGETMAVLTSPPGISLRMARSLDLSIAGAESNVAIGLARLGVPVTWWGRVGADELGRLILAKLAGEDVGNAGAVVDNTAPTGVMFKERRAPDLVRVTYYRRDSAGSRFSPADIPDPLPQSARLLHLSGITPALSEPCRRAVDAAITAAKASGMTISFDLNYRSGLWPPEVAAPALRGIAARADIIFATRQEAGLLQGSDGHVAEESLCRSLTALGPDEAVLKLGSEGAMSISGDVMQTVPAEATTVVDLVGAGDAFVAGYLAAFLDQAAPVDRLTTAVRTAAFALAAPGDWEGLPSRSELDLWHSATDGVHR
jgi:2-dehydro-3-deoxygluconokinase